MTFIEISLGTLGASIFSWKRKPISESHRADRQKDSAAEEGKTGTLIRGRKKALVYARRKTAIFVHLSARGRTALKVSASLTKSLGIKDDLLPFFNLKRKAFYGVPGSPWEEFPPYLKSLLAAQRSSKETSSFRRSFCGCWFLGTPPRGGVRGEVLFG